MYFTAFSSWTDVRVRRQVTVDSYIQQMTLINSNSDTMKEHIEEALEIWETDVEYTVAMSNAAEDEMIDDIDPSDFDESTFEDEE